MHVLGLPLVVDVLVELQTFGVLVDVHPGLVLEVVELHKALKALFRPPLALEFAVH